MNRKQFSSSPLTSDRTVATSAPTSADELASARAYCRDLVQKFDYPSYILSTFTPSNAGTPQASAKDAYLAIRAFNIDIARIADQVSNVMVGRMRMQFWRDTVEKVYAGKPPREPVAVLLESVVNGGRGSGIGMGKSWFLRVIAARESYLGNPPFPTLAHLETYAENTYSSLHYLHLESLSIHSTKLDHIASHIGKATGIVAILRGLPYLARSNSPPDPTPAGRGTLRPVTGTGRGTVPLPLDVCAEFNVRQEDILRHGGGIPGVKDSVFKVATLANDHLITARKMVEESGKESKSDVAFGTFLSAVPTSLFLERLEKVDFDIFHSSLHQREWKLPWRAYWAYQRKKF